MLTDCLFACTYTGLPEYNFLGEDQLIGYAQRRNRLRNRIEAM